MEVPSSATINVRVAKVENARMPRLPRENFSSPVPSMADSAADESCWGLGGSWDEAS